jgi:endoglycosylceramidase
MRSNYLIIVLFLISSLIPLAFSPGDTPATPDLPYVPLLDEQGRTLILHGCNYMGMEFGWFNHSAADFEKIAEWGFNVVRLPIAWNYIEPVEGEYDQTYITEVIDRAVGYAADAGLHVIIDMHQWNWSPCSHGNGAPAWTCDTPTGEEFDWLRQAHLFWDHPEYLDHFVGAWEQVAIHFAGDDRVWGYDLWNEPNAGLRSLPWTCENQLIRPLFRRFIDAIRAHHPEPYILIEPVITHVAGLPFVMDPFPDERLIYAPHHYATSTGAGGDYYVDKVQGKRRFQRYQDEANEWGLPLLIGETGVVSNASRAEDYARDHTELMDEFKFHFTWWTFWRDNTSYAFLDAGGNEKPIVEYLSRTYPRATAGHLYRFSFDNDTAEFQVKFENKTGMNPSVEIWIPAARHYPDGFEVSCSDADGTWSWDFDASSSILTVDCDPGEKMHLVSVEPVATSFSRR